tara:strand:+ start:732 stop:944 length:213 start_codon:yes stop_codon:yes gene_type:complete
MRVKKLKKTELGILITYKSFFKTKEREVIWIEKFGRWGWADEDLHGHCWVDDLLNKFIESEKTDYILNNK